MFKRLPKYFGALLAMVLVSALALVVASLGATLVQSFSVTVLKAAEWTERATVQAKYTVTTIMNVYYIAIGILLLGFVVLMDQYLLVGGVKQKLVLRRTLLTLGIELLLLALFQGLMMTYLPAGTLQIVLAAFETVLGVVFIYFSRRKATASS